MIRLGGSSARSVLWTIAIVGVLSIPSVAARAQQVCVGDCDHGGTVTINEIIIGVNIALGSLPVTSCPGFENPQGTVDIAQLIKAVSAALNGCGGAIPTTTGGVPATPTPTGGVPASPTPTSKPTPPLTRVRLTNLQLKYDLTKPAFLNNAVPIKFGITSNSADPSNPGGGSVLVLFSFVEAAPADPANPRSCASNGIELALVGNGVEQQFQADIFPTSDCASWVGASAVANLAVDFDPGLRMAGTPTGIDYPPVVFSTANAGGANNQLCRKTPDPNAADPGRGCVYPLILNPTPMGADGKPLVDVKLDSLTPDSSVAVLWPTQPDPDVPMGDHESEPPSMLVNAAFFEDGRDPYEFPIDPSLIPPELVAEDPTIVNDLKFGLSDADLAALDDLPGPAMIKYDLVPTHLLAPDAWLPLAIDDPANPNPDGHVPMIEIGNLEPGTDNSFAHALYIEGDARAAVSPGGAWATETDFTIRGCIIASFPEGGDAGDELDPDEMPAGGDVPMGDCKTFKVVLMRAPVPSASAALRLGSAADVAVTSHSFDQTFNRAVGNAEKAQISGTLSTSNTLDLNGASSNSEGVLELKGYLNVKLFRAFAKASALTALATSSYDVGVEAFGISLFARQMAGAELTYEMPFTMAPMFQFPVFSIGFGLASIGITAGVGGEVGITPKITLSAKQGPPDPPVMGLEKATSNGLLQVTFTPSAALTGNVTGGIDLVIAKAALVAMLDVLRIGFPVSGELRWGVTGIDMATMAVNQLTVTGGLKWDLTLTWLNFTLDAVGGLGKCPGFFCISKTINIFKYQNPGETINLLMRTLPAPIVLGAAGMPTPTGGPDMTPTPTGGADMTPTPTGGTDMTPTPTGGTDMTPTPTGGTDMTPTPTGGAEDTPTPTPTPTGNVEPTAMPTDMPTIPTGG